MHRPQYSSSLVVSANLAGEMQILDAANGQTLRSFSGKRSSELGKVHETLPGPSSEGKLDRREEGLRVPISRPTSSTAQLSFSRKRSREAWVDPLHDGEHEAKKGPEGNDEALVGATAPLLCVRAGMTRIVGAHTDHTLTVHNFNGHG